MADMKERTVTMPDGRTVGVTDYGGLGQTAAIWCHGGPGCRFEPEYVAEAAARIGVRIVGIDRPGYGRSTPHPGRTLGGWVDDALAVANHLGLERFATVGASTGGAYALAIAAKSPRVIAVVACCALTDMRWAEGKATIGWKERVWSAEGRAAALEAAEVQLGVGGSQASSTAALNLAPSDERLFADSRWTSCWTESIAEWFAQGIIGYADDRIADRDGWHTFDARRIACPVAVLHGTSDTFVPVAHAFHTQRVVPGASLEVREGLGHFSILPEIVPVLGKLLEQRAAMPDAAPRRQVR